MSLVGDFNAAADAAVAQSIASGVAYSVAAGNEGMLDGACTRSPASTTASMQVAATTLDDSRASFSNYGACIDWYAPGDAISSAWYTGDVDTVLLSGTSMATAHNSGVAALYLDTDPSATPAAVAAALAARATPGVVAGAGPGGNGALLFSR